MALGPVPRVCGQGRGKGASPVPGRAHVLWAAEPARRHSETGSSGAPAPLGETPLPWQPARRVWRGARSTTREETPCGPKGDHPVSRVVAPCRSRF